MIDQVRNISKIEGDISVLVYRSHFGQLSETFVIDHINGLKHVKPSILTNRVHKHGACEGVQLTVVGNESLLQKWLWNRGIAPSLDLLLRTCRPSIIHAHFLFDGVGILPFARKRGIPLIVTAHGYDATLYEEALQASSQGRMLLRHQHSLANYATKILCVSDFIHEQLLLRGYPPQKLQTLPLGVDVNALRPSRGEEPRKGIVTVGRLVEKKGTSYLIRAYAGLDEATRSNHKLTVIGDGPLRDELENLAKDLRLSVTFTGAQSREVVLESIRKARVFCLPSVRAKSGDAEGMPIAIMEALSLGVPTVIFDDQPAAKLFAATGGGATAKAGDIESLTTEIRNLLVTDDRAEKMALAGRILAETHFDFQRSITKLENIYTEIAADDTHDSRRD